MRARDRAPSRLLHTAAAAAVGHRPPAALAATAPPAARPQESGEGENDAYKFGVSAMQGWRTDMVRRVPPGGGVALRTTARMAGTSKGAQPPCNPLGLPDAACHLTCNSPWLAVLLQEDAHAAILDLPDGSSKGALFAVLDGHGGAEVARFVANHLVRLRAGRRLCSNGLDPTRKCVSSSPG